MSGDKKSKEESWIGNLIIVVSICLLAVGLFLILPPESEQEYDPFSEFRMGFGEDHPAFAECEVGGDCVVGYSYEKEDDDWGNWEEYRGIKDTSLSELKEGVKVEGHEYDYFFKYITRSNEIRVTFVAHDVTVTMTNQNGEVIAKNDDGKAPVKTAYINAPREWGDTQ